MDIYTFLLSVEVLSEGFKEIININTKSFGKLREYGLQLEKRMFCATGNINTYKGAIFILILIYAGIINANSYSEVTVEIRNLTHNILQDFSEKGISNGIEIYHKHKILGIRGQAYNGFSLFFNTFEPYFAREQNIMKLYLMIIGELDDTTIIKRSSISKLRYIQKKVQKIVDFPEKWGSFNSYCKRHNISCGGSSDVLATVLILNLVKQNYTYFI